MILRTIKLFIVILVFSTPFAARADSVTPSGQTAGDGNAGQAKYERLSSELRQLESGLPAKKTELARLHRKWVVAKGRMPTSEELKTFNEKSAEGVVKIEDNPYVNKSALSTPGRYRMAYFQKRDEIRADEARIATLRNELHSVGSSLPAPVENLK
ncbi:MAG: hypothetical protein EG822_11575 [Deltaproteobacteria bacterium]|nr:hypothetical protein [Deltaproteobacteria bacterium]TLN04157.1 MAG: hypothetical protein FDZ73_04560 [bacterium]